MVKTFLENSQIDTKEIAVAEAKHVERKGRKKFKTEERECDVGYGCQLQWEEQGPFTTIIPPL